MRQEIAPLADQHQEHLSLKKNRMKDDDQLVACFLLGCLFIAPILIVGLVNLFNPASSKKLDYSTAYRLGWILTSIGVVGSLVSWGRFIVLLRKLERKARRGVSATLDMGVSPQARYTSGKRESDNKGTRHETAAEAIAYWMGTRPHMTRKDPFVIYTFKSSEDARAALLELPCIQMAEDTQRLICTEPLTFGYYLVDPVWEAVLCGDDLTKELWDNAKRSFAKHAGKPKTEQEPPKKDTEKSERVVKPEVSRVRFLREETHPVRGQPCKYLVHEASNREEAMAFLGENPVKQNYLYIVVETPDGNYCRDLNGIYKE